MQQSMKWWKLSELGKEISLALGGEKPGQETRAVSRPEKDLGASTAGWVSALLTADLDLILRTPYGPWSPSRSVS